MSISQLSMLSCARNFEQILRRSMAKALCAIILFCGVGFVVPSAYATDDYIPPKVDTTTPTGVSMSDGSFIYNTTDLSIGTLTLERFHMGGFRDPVGGAQFGVHMSHNFDIYVSQNYKSYKVNGVVTRLYTPVVHIGASASGMYEQSAENLTYVNADTDEAMDGTLEYANGYYTYTSQDGTVYSFTHWVPADNTNYPPHVASIVYPSGRTLTFSYVNQKLKLVSDNSGYAIVFDYNGSGFVSAACGFNLATTGVSTSTTCSGASLKTTYGYASTTYFGSGSALLTSITDVLGQTTNLSYAYNEITCVQPAGYSGCRIQNTYGDSSARSRVTQQTLGDGTVWNFVSSGGANMRNPNNLSYTDDPSDFGSVTDPAGNTTNYYFSGTSPYTVTDALSRTTNYRFTGGNINDTSVYEDPPPIHAEGKLLVSATYPEGNSYAVEHEGPYLTISKETYTSKTGRSATFLYGYGICPTRQNCTKPIWKKDPLGNQTDYTYDDAGNLLSEMAPAPSSGAPRPLKLYTYQQKYAYISNGYGGLMAASSPIWKITSEVQCQTGAGSNTPVCDDSGPKTIKTYQYGADGTANNLLPASVTTQSKDGSLAATTTFTYTDAGDVATADGPLPGDGDKTFTTYDLMRRKVGEIGAAYYPSDGSTKRSATRTTYRPSGEVLQVEVGAVDGQSSPDWSSFDVRNWTVNEFDGYGRVVKVSKQHYENGAVVTAGVVQTSYDSVGRVLCSTVRQNPAAFGSLPDACSLGTEGSYGPDRITRNTYDAAGQLITITRAYGTSLQQDYATYSYSANGKQTSVADARNFRTEYAFDDFDRLSQITFPSPTNPGLANTGDYEAYGYDLNGNRTSLRKRDGRTITYAYDSLNRVSVKSWPDGTTVTSAYDYISHLTSATQNNGEAVSSTYDELGRKTSEVSHGKTIGYQYDIGGRRTAVTWPDGYWVSYEYDPSGHMTAVRQAGSALLASFVFDRYGRPAWEQFGGGSTHSVAYAWSADDDLNTLSNSFANGAYNVSYTNAFSPAKQITAADISNSAFVYQQSANGTTNYDTNGLNQYTAVGGQGVGYDANGNLTSDGTFSFGYDIENRLTGASSSSLNASYAYDPLGRRYQKVANGATSTYLNSGDDEIAEYSDAGANNLTRRYIPGPAIDRPVAMVDYTSGQEAVRFFYTDRQGGVVAMSDSAGNPTEGPYTYSEFGECQSGGQDCSGGVPYKYTGRRYDAETGLYYYRARYYSARLGRFLQTDPIGYKDDLNWYAYVGNDPTDKTDPSGQSFLEIGLAIADVAQTANDIRNGASAGELLLDAGNLILDAAPMPGLSEVAHLAEAGKIAAKATEAYKGSKLARNMAKAGNAVEKGTQQAHHIVAKNAKNAGPARKALEKAGIGIDDARNGAAMDKSAHQTAHTNEYYNQVNNTLTEAAASDNPTQAVGQALDALKKPLQSK